MPGIILDTEEDKKAATPIKELPVWRGSRFHCWTVINNIGFPRWLSGKQSTCQSRRHGFNPWVGKIPGGGNGNPLQYPCCDNPMDRGAWRAAVYGGLKELDLSERAHRVYKQHGSPGQNSTWELSISLSTSLQVIWKLKVTLQRVLLSEIVFSIHFLSLLERKNHRERHLSVLFHCYSLNS